MRLENEFIVPRPIDEAWEVLTDLERIAPCMPGAQLTEVDGEDYHGTVKVKVGPVVVQYAGVARFKERDDAAHHAVLEGKGKERTGRGMASALVTADLTEAGENTHVRVATDLTISGPLAQFGRGTIAEVSSKLLGQFVDRLKETVLDQNGRTQRAAPVGAVGETLAEPTPVDVAPSPPTPSAEPGSVQPFAAGLASAAAPAATIPAATGRRLIDSPEAAPADLLQVAGTPLLKRLLPVVVVLALAVLLAIWLA